MNMAPCTGRWGSCTCDLIRHVVGPHRCECGAVWDDDGFLISPPGSARRGFTGWLARLLWRLRGGG